MSLLRCKGLGVNPMFLGDSRMALMLSWGLSAEKNKLTAGYQKWLGGAGDLAQQHKHLPCKQAIVISIPGTDKKFKKMAGRCVKAASSSIL